jgi:hypothetical protein
MEEETPNTEEKHRRRKTTKIKQNSFKTKEEIDKQ